MKNIFKKKPKSASGENSDLGSPDTLQSFEQEEKAKARAFISKQWWSSAGARSVGAIGKLSKSFLLPIALLPIAGLCIGGGAALGEIKGASDGFKLFAQVINQMGSVCFANLVVLFLISAIIAFTNDTGSAVLAGFVAFLIFNVIIATLISVDVYQYQYNFTYETTAGKTVTTTWEDANNVPLYSGNIVQYILDHDKSGIVDYKAGTLTVNDITKVTDSYNLLFYKDVPAALFVNILGLNSLNTGILAGVVVGCIVAYVYNRTYKVNLPTAINFFSGIKLVPIVMFFAIIPLAFFFMITWPPVGKGLDWFGRNSGKLPIGLDSFIFGLGEHGLEPFGLHHVFYAPLWWTSAGGGPLSSIPDGTLADYSPNGAPSWEHLLWILHDSKRYLDITSVAELKAALTPQLLSAVGDQTLSFAVVDQSSPVFLTFDDIYNGLGLNLSRFQCGKSPYDMFGLPAASIAIWLTVPKAHRRDVMGIYFSAALTSFLTGITEPIEYTFLFVAPWLFFGVHLPLTMFSFWAMGGLHCHTCQSVSGGFLDFIIFGILPAAKYHTRFWLILIAGPILSVLYGSLFYFLVKWRNVKVPGRDGAVDKLYTKADYKAKKADKHKNKGQEKLIENAFIILEALGGKDNVTSIDACASRLRVDVVDKSLIDENAAKAIGASGVRYTGSQCQMIFGGTSDVYKSLIKDIISGRIKKPGLKPALNVISE